jgi:hypothetical protein
MWKPSPKILRGPADVFKMGQPAPSGHHFEDAGGDALKLYSFFSRAAMLARIVRAIQVCIQSYGLRTCT